MADHDAESSSSHFVYDIFLSFRGFTRYGFTDRLYHGLCERGITTFRDDENLRVGDRIRDTLLEAIERSKMSIVVLCQNYASSSWCLDELVQIMKCSDKGTKRPVLPIFYHVEPSDIRHQKNQYEKDMMNHETRYGKDSCDIKSWKIALYEVCDLSGKHCTANSYESEIIKNIVEEVSKKLPPEPLYIKHPIGFASRFEEVESLLDIKSHDTICMLVIYGNAHKTTFVGELFNKLKHQFEAASFLDKVSEKLKRSTLEGSSDINQSLCNKRVLLVLDDVDSTAQLDLLATASNWFCPGSKIVITIRDLDVLNKHALDGFKIVRYCIDEDEVEGTEVVESSQKQDQIVDDEEDMVGFLNIFNNVIEQLKENESFLNVISIIGMGGIGKTTLATKIYNNKEVKKLFSCCVWVTVSMNYKARELLLSLLDGLMLSTSTCNNLSEKKLKTMVQEYLTETKYLIILDDFWEPQVWDEVECLFPNNKNGSAILITTRNGEVANYTGSKSYYPQFLNKDESWELFCRKVFKGRECPSTLEPIGRSIVEKCGGLPLAVVTLAGVVAKKKRLQVEWMRIKRYVLWFLAKDEDRVTNVLRLSYDSLPQRLKPCFLFLSVYPENYEIHVKKLIQLWIAEGLIEQPKVGIRRSDVPEVEDVAEEYLNELVDRCLVMVARRRSDGGVKSCRIHDLLRDLCISESKDDKDLEICTQEDISSLNKIKSCRLSLGDMKLVDWHSFAKKCDHSCIHSLMCFLEIYQLHHWDIDLMSFNSACILDFGKARLSLSTPQDLNMLIHLKYLRVDMNISAKYGYLDSICTLPNLETLYLDDVFGAYLPIGIWKLKQLRHLCVYSCWITSDIFLPDMSGEDVLPNLQTLQLVSVKGMTMSPSVYGRFPKLRKLGLRWNKSSKCTVREQLQGLHCLNNLEKLRLVGFPELALDACEFPSNIIKITIQVVRGVDIGEYKYNCMMKTLGRLTNLRVMKINLSSHDRDNYSLSLCCAAGSFPNLEVLHLKGKCIRGWILERSAMPCLQHLIIDWCKLMDELPEQLWSLTTLQDVLLLCPNNKLRESLQNIKLQNGCKIIVEDAFSLS